MSYMDIDRVKSYLDDNPTAYAGLRALHISDMGRKQNTAEKDEVPFIFSVVFVPLMIVYIVLRRTVYRIRCVFNGDELDITSSPDHVFMMTSTHEYRTHTFEEVGERLLDENKEVLFLCSPDAVNRMKEWSERGFQTASFRYLLRFVSVRNIFVHLIKSVRLIREIKRITSDEFQDPSVKYAFNSIFLEYIKYISLQQTVSDNPGIHTYSLMPYQVRTTVPERLYVYQHGVQFTPNGEYSGAKSFFPSTLFLWGESWIKNFEPLTHPESKICVTGSPWHSYLSEMMEEGTNEWDVLFLGGSQVTEHSEKREQLYEELVANLVDACENSGWSLAIKLHPTETDSWYRQRQYEHYVREFESLENAINSADIAVTHYSSAFIECIAMGTPVILDEGFSSGLDKLRPIKGAYFIENDKIKDKIGNIKRSELKSGEIIEDNRLLESGCSIEMIMEIISRVTDCSC